MGTGVEPPGSGISSLHPQRQAPRPAGPGSPRGLPCCPGAGGGEPGPPGGALRLPLAAVVWLLAGAAMSGLNKWIFAVHDFRYPVLLSSLHMLAAVLVGVPLARRRAHGAALGARTKARIGLLSLTFCASVAFGNLGLNYAQLDFAQTVYATTPLFTLALSAALLRRRHHPLQYAAMAPICLGASCSLLGEGHVDRAGCCFLLAATFLRGLKSLQQSALLQEERLDAVALLGLTSLPSFCILFPAAAVLEVGAAWGGLLHYGAALWACVLLSCLGSVLYNLASFCLLALTSALTLHVLGNLSVVANLLLARLLFGSRLSGLSYAGIGLALAGVFVYHNCHLLAARWGARRGRAKPE
ncbi:solute carrier family 35 member E4 [Pelodiscus sinensis]|uniref:solute carrier family 35 member E4 n=1 Tax=Pelodiscus sinensis TaxID=13735 RepID=UPI003F6C4476